MSRDAASDAGRHETVTLESRFEALRSSPEFRGPVDPLEDHDHATEHVALIYESREEQFAAAIPFIRQGLERGERCLYITYENSREAVVEAMRADDIDVDAALGSGQLSIHDEAETYLRNGTFDADDTIEFLDAAIEEAAEAYDALRVTGEMSSVLEADPEGEELVRCEAKANYLFDDVDGIALCQYNRERFPADVIRDVISTHPLLIHDNRISKNVYYTPPEEFFGPDRSAREVDRLLGSLRDQTDTKAALQQRERYQRELYEITADPDLATDEKIERLLDVGRERLDLPVGMFNRDHGTTLEVKQMHGTHPELSEGSLTPSSSDHYSRQVVDTSEPVTVPDTGAAGWDGDPLYDEAGLEAFVGIPVTVGGDVYGTLCFADTSPRDGAFTEAERGFIDLLGQCVGYEIERTRRETRLSLLDDIGRELLDAETADAVAEGVVAATEDTFERPVAAIGLYDKEAGELSLAAHTDAAEQLVAATSLFERSDGVGWEAFIERETKRVADPLARGDADTAENPPVSEAIVHPLGNHGVYVVGATAPDGFRHGDTGVIETAAANIRAALDRTDRERQLQEREQVLETQNETLERLNRVNDTIRHIDQALVEASSREEIERVVCQELADIGPYEMAWIGDADGVTGELTVRESAGAEKGYLDAITITVDDSPRGRGPAGRAIKTDETQVVNNVIEDESFKPWRQDTLNRGYHTVAALPLSYEDTRYGVLTVYAGQADVFDDLEHEVLTELSATIAHAINAVESKKALVTDRVTELEFTVADRNLGVVELARELDCEFEHKRLVSRADGSVRAFFAVRGASASDVLEFESRLPVTDLRLVSNPDDGACMFEATLTDESLPATVVDHGGRLRQIRVEDGTATVVVHLATDADVREFVEMIGSKYPDSELTAQRAEESPQRTALEFVTALMEDLTARQGEILETAYFNGYFDEPRAHSASEIAESMGISQPTFTSHLRTALRKLCRHIYERNTASA